MTVYYLSMSFGVDTPGPFGAPHEATSDPTTAQDVTLRIGDQVPVANLPRSFVIESLRTFISYLEADDPRQNGANVIPLLRA